MSFVPIIAAGAATSGATAAAHQQRLYTEEEILTVYSDEDLENDWEFKIVRSDLGAFGKRETLERLMQEEAWAGWTMLEKFDDYRVRFKRPLSARAQDPYLPEGVDPYRTHYGRSVGLYVIVAVALVVAVVLGVVLFTVLLTG
jgi:hypothetical protein